MNQVDRQHSTITCPQMFSVVDLVLIILLLANFSEKSVEHCVVKARMFLSPRSVILDDVAAARNKPLHVLAVAGIDGNVHFWDSSAQLSPGLYIYLCSRDTEYLQSLSFSQLSATRRRPYAHLHTHSYTISSNVFRLPLCFAN